MNFIYLVNYSAFLSVSAATFFDITILCRYKIHVKSYQYSGHTPFNDITKLGPEHVANLLVDLVYIPQKITEDPEL